jgi:hypothetical protein
MLFGVRTRTHSVFRGISLAASGFPFLANRRCELKRRAFRWARPTSLHRLPARSTGHSTIPCARRKLGGVERVEEPLRLLRAEPDVRIPYGEENRVRRAGPLLDEQYVREVGVARVVLLARAQPPKLMRTMAEPLVWALKAYSL